MTLVRIELISLESELEIKLGERVFKLTGGEKVSVELPAVDALAVLRLTRNATGAEKFRGVPLEDPEMRMRPVPASEHAGTFLIRDNQEFYQTPKSKKKK